jgi:hypothetical protein
MDVEHDGGASPNTVLNVIHVEVDVDGIADFRALLGRELDTNLRPAVAGIHADQAVGVGFGHAMPGKQIEAAQASYRAVLQGSTKILATYIAVAEELNAAMQRISERYRDADLTSARMSDAVRTELAAAADTAVQRIRMAEIEAEHETRRELNRLRAGRL